MKVINKKSRGIQSKFPNASGTSIYKSRYLVLLEGHLIAGLEYGVSRAFAGHVVLHKTDLEESGRVGRLVVIVLFLLFMMNENRKICVQKSR